MLIELITATELYGILRQRFSTCEPESALNRFHIVHLESSPVRVQVMKLQLEVHRTLQILTLANAGRTYYGNGVVRNSTATIFYVRA
ncbi:hypothetical protein QE152_g7139 [Popillia japonica]|uniref:Uncharacterized protein n=1 Tax=Popillia japonica TaxID=7064 RepID=A0AAW1MFM1_POPJA